MAGICYFIPGAGKISIQQVKALGLGYAFDDGCAQCGANDGPSKCAGVVIANQATKPDRLGYYRQQQTWIKANQGAYWVCVNSDGDKPKPARLEREEMVSGHNVTLGDGNEWLIPVVRSIVRGSQLPYRHILDENGKWTTRPMDVYVSLSDQAERFAALILGSVQPLDEETDEEPAAEMTKNESRNLAIDAIGVNYRIGPWEISQLELLTDRTIYNINKAVIDFPSILAMSKAIDDAKAKKNTAQTPEPDSINDGQRDSNLITSQPTPT